MSRRVSRVRNQEGAKIAAQAAGGRIVRVEGVCGGEPVVAGTRVPVRSVVLAYQEHHDLGRVHQAYPRVNVPSIRAALEYYEDHREEIDRLIEENERASEVAG